MTGPHLRKPWNETEQAIAVRIRRGSTYKEIGAELRLKEDTVKKYTARMATMIEGMNELGDELPPRWKVYAYFGLIEYVAGMRERFFKTA
jgi:hypothetical protein